jgi:NADH dehydrogenase
MNLVVGATGLLGGELCRRLRAKGKPVRALVRPSADPAKLEKLREAGVTFSQGDLKSPSTLEAACRDVTTVISTASSTFSRQAGDSIQTVDELGQLNLLEVARTAGVRHFIFISFPPMAEDCPLQEAKRKVEQRLIGSGLTYTVLQPTFFTEVWLSPALGFDIAGGKARIYGAGHNKISWISFLDVAEFGVASVENAAARNAVIKLGGPEALSPLEVVKICEELSGRQFAIEHVPEEALRAQKAAATDPFEESFAALMLSYAAGQPIEMQATLATFLLKLLSVRDYLKAASGLN